MWRGPYEVDGKTQAGNYLLKGVRGKGKGKVRNIAVPPNQLKRYIARGIPGRSSGVLIPGHTSSSDETIKIEIGQIPGHTNSGDSDDTIEVDVVGEISGCTACGHTMEAAEILATLAAGGDPNWLPDLTVPEEPEESPLEVLVALAEDADAEILDDTSADAEILGHTNVPILGHTSEESPIIIESFGSNLPSWKEKWFETIKVGFHR